MIITTNKNEWEPKITLSKIFKIKSDHGVDLLDIDPDGKGLLIVGDDIIKFFEILYITVSEQATEKSIDFQSFVDEFTSGDQIEKASDAVVEATFPFFKSNIKDALQKAYEKSKEISKQVTDDICANIEKLTIEDVNEASQKVREAREKALDAEEAKENA